MKIRSITAAVLLVSSLPSFAATDPVPPARPNRAVVAGARAGAAVAMCLGAGMADVVSPILLGQLGLLATAFYSGKYAVDRIQRQETTWTRDMISLGRGIGNNFDDVADSNRDCKKYAGHMTAPIRPGTLGSQVRLDQTQKNAQASQAR